MLVTSDCLAKVTVYQQLDWTNKSVAARKVVILQRTRQKRNNWCQKWDLKIEQDGYEECELVWTEGGRPEEGTGGTGFGMFWKQVSIAVTPQTDIV